MEGYLGWTEETVDKNEPEICTRWEKSAPMGVLEEQWMSSMSPGNEEHFFKCPDPKCKKSAQRLHVCYTNAYRDARLSCSYKASSSRKYNNTQAWHQGQNWRLTTMISASPFTVKRLLVGTISFLDKKLDSLSQYNKSISPPHGNGTALPFGPRISHWHFGNLDGQSGNTGMRHSMTAPELTGCPKENSTPV
jgi:hypothetical protein